MNEIEVYIYLFGSESMNSNSELIFLRTSSIKPLQSANFNARLRSVYLGDTSKDAGDVTHFLPSQLGQMWNPTDAISHQINKRARLDIDHVIKTTNVALPGDVGTEINIILDSSTIDKSADREPYISDLFFAFFIEYVYFSVAIYSIFVVLGDSLFQFKTFKSITKLEK